MDDDAAAGNEAYVREVLLKARDQVLDLIANHGKHVLVHCAAGISRSAAVVVACLMRLHKADADTALELLRHSRACCKPNTLFMRVLRTLEQTRV
jgi:protein-tyrosine phosphatase